MTVQFVVMRSLRVHAATAVAATIGISACGGSDSATDTAPEAVSTEAASNAVSGIRVVSPQQAAATLADPPADLVILDVRTPAEFAEGHLDGAVMLDFYREDFAAELAELDPDVPYVLYCRSGNRSGQTRAMMEQLGFASVQDVDGGVLGWEAVGLALTTG